MIFFFKKLYWGGGGVFVCEFSPLDDKKKSSAHHTKGFWGKKRFQSRYRGIFKKNCQLWAIACSRLPNYNMFFFLFVLTCSQIWLSPLANDHQCGYSTKLAKEKFKRKNPG